MLSELYVNGIRVSGDIPEDNYLAGLPVVRHLIAMGGLEFTRPVTFLVGENGMGKSTLIEAIAVALGFNPEGGTVNFMFSTMDSHSGLHGLVTLSKGVKRPRDGFFLRAESFYNAASYIDRDPETLAGYGGVPLHSQSHGESFLSLFENRFSGRGIYILDEPEAALSPTRTMRLMVYMDQLVRAGSQFIVSTHSPMLMAFPGAEVLELSEDGIRSTPYYDTEHFIVAKRFLNAPERMLRYLLEEE